MTLDYVGRKTGAIIMSKSKGIQIHDYRGGALRLEGGQSE